MNLTPVVLHVCQGLFQFGSFASLDLVLLFTPLSQLLAQFTAVLAFTKFPAIDLVNGQRARSMSLTFGVNSGLPTQSYREHPLIKILLAVGVALLLCNFLGSSVKIV